MKPNNKKIDEAKWAVVTWKIVKKELLHNYPNEYCNGRVYIDKQKEIK